MPRSGQRTSPPTPRGSRASPTRGDRYTRRRSARESEEVSRSTSAALAYGSDDGERRPVNAGTTYTPAGSGTDAASGPISDASPMTPRPSRSHWIAAPVTNIFFFKQKTAYEIGQ